MIKNKKKVKKKLKESKKISRNLIWGERKVLRTEKKKK